jgi:hypothetical protein
LKYSARASPEHGSPSTQGAGIGLDGDGMGSDMDVVDGAADAAGSKCTETSFSQPRAASGAARAQ